MSFQGSETQASQLDRTLEVVRLFLKLGLTAFGGPAVHVAMMHNEVVVRRKWIDEQHFLDLFGAANLIPGPTSTEMAIYLGAQRAGWMGLALGGICFILPAMLIVLGLAWVYVHYGTTPFVVDLFYGIKPAVIAIIIQALWSMSRKAIRDTLAVLVGIAVVVFYLLSVNVLWLLLAAGLLVMLSRNYHHLRDLKKNVAFLPIAGLAVPATAAAFSLPLLFLTFLKIGSILYGSGYVLLAFLRADLVLNLGWLTDHQLLDAIAVGQVTPGPVSATATFIGYLVGGFPGALLATLGIFLPAFVFVGLSSLLIPYVRRSDWVSGLLEGVTIASLGLMAGVTLQLGVASLSGTGTLIDPFALIVFLTGLILLFYFKLNSTWLIAGGALAGLLHLVLR
jgi:chromate transporter